MLWPEPTPTGYVTEVAERLHQYSRTMQLRDTVTCLKAWENKPQLCKCIY